MNSPLSPHNPCAATKTPNNPQKEIPFRTKKEQITNTYNDTNEPENHYIKQKKVPDKKNTFCVTVLMATRLYSEENQNSGYIWV